MTNQHKMRSLSKPEAQLLGVYTKQNSLYHYFWHYACANYDEAISSGNNDTLFFHEGEVIRVMDACYRRRDRMNYQKIVTMMQRNDPNGEYSVDDCRENSLDYLRILKNWYMEIKVTGKKVPKWLMLGIQWLETIV